MLRSLIHIFFAAWIILSGAGYTVFEHHCHCKGSEEISLLAKHECEAHTESSPVSESNVSACCQEKMAPAGSGTLKPLKKCCDTIKLAYFRTNDFVVSAVVFQFTPNQTHQALQSDYICFDKDCESPAVLSTGSSPPRAKQERKLKLLLEGAFHSSLS